MRLVGLLTVTLLAAGGYSAARIVSGTPAFNTVLRQDTVYGDWRTGYSTDMYDQGSYLFQLGHGRVMADLLFSEDTEAIGEIADVDTAFARAEEAVEFLQQSLALDPANAHAWATLAWAAAMISDPELTHQALGNSWALAPYNRQLADRRVSLVATLTSPDEIEPLELSEAGRAALARDVALLGQRDRAALDDYKEISPLVADLAAAAEGV